MSREGGRSAELAEFTGLLQREGCPICHATANSDDRFFFWFFTEQYYTSHMLDHLDRSHGFCVAHAARIVSTGTGGHQLVGAYRVLVERMLRAMTQDKFFPTEACPACKSLDEASQNKVWFLASLLKEEAEFVSRYGRPGTLCLRHLRAVAYHVPAPLLERLLSIEETALLSAPSALKQLRIEAGSLGSGNPVELGLLPLLRLALGHDRGDWLFPSIPEDDGDLAARDPVTDLLETIRRPNVCCAC